MVTVSAGRLWRTVTDEDIYIKKYATLFLNERIGQAKHGLAVIGFSLGVYYAYEK
jgi:hypothetical protein